VYFDLEIIFGREIQNEIIKMNSPGFAVKKAKNEMVERERTKILQ